MSLSILESDSEDQQGNLSQIEKDLTEAVTARAAGTDNKQQKQQEESQDEGSDDIESKLPPKLRGKSLEEIVASYVNLESAYGRMANDLGTQRRITDQLLALKRETDLGQNGGQAQKPQLPQLTATELLENPVEAVSKVVEATTKAERERQTAERQREAMQQAEQAFMQRHPDVSDIVNSQEFIDWAKKSQYRTRLGLAASQGNLEAADELLTVYKDYKSEQTEQSQQRQQSGVDKARAAGLESGTAAASDGAGATKKPGKVFRRADLLALRMRNPEKYYSDDFQREIILAYQDGRVR